MSNSALLQTGQIKINSQAPYYPIATKLTRRETVGMERLANSRLRGPFKADTHASFRCERNEHLQAEILPFASY